MHKTMVRLAVMSALALSSSAALALPFNSFDPRSMAMGGAGVAVGDAGMAPFFNPALLAVTKDEDDFSMNLPIVGVRAYDPEDFFNSVDAFQNGKYTETLQASIDSFNAATGATLTDIANNTDTLSTQLQTLDSKPFQVEAGAALVIGIPSKKFGGAFYANGWGAVEGVVNYRDAATLTEFADVMRAVDLCGPDTACIDAIPNVTNYYNRTTNQTVYTTDNLASSVDIRAVILGETGLAFARQFGEGSGSWTLGLTPKLVKVNLYEYSSDTSGADTGNSTADEYLAEYSHVNLDIGLAKNFNNGWRTGFVVKNVISHTYEFKNTPLDPVTGLPLPGAESVATGNTINLKPQARLGVSHQTTWSTVALDIDMTSNDPVGSEQKSRYVALGGELNAWDWVQLRAGYRLNTYDSNRNVASVGIGLAIAGTLHVDVGAAGNDKEVGASAQIGLQF